LETHPELRRGDAFLNNSPYHGNSHAAGWSLLVPVIEEAGVHRYTVLAKAHLADCGNAVPTTYSAGARDVYRVAVTPDGDLDPAATAKLRA